MHKSASRGCGAASRGMDMGMAVGTLQYDKNRCCFLGNMARQKNFRFRCWLVCGFFGLLVFWSSKSGRALFNQIWPLNATGRSLAGLSSSSRCLNRYNNYVRLMSSGSSSIMLLTDEIDCISRGMRQEYMHRCWGRLQHCHPLPVEHLLSLPYENCRLEESAIFAC